MPTPEEIKKIAHEYGVLMAKDIPESNCLKIEVISSTEEYLVQFMSRLCTNYCIVPKKKIAEWEGIVEDAFKADQVITEPSFRFMWMRLFEEDKK